MHNINTLTYVITTILSAQSCKLRNTGFIYYVICVRKIRRRNFFYDIIYITARGIYFYSLAYDKVHVDRIHPRAKIRRRKIITFILVRYCDLLVRTRH
jgi:hypothetical protein